MVKRSYSRSIKVPVFGEIPLLPSEFIADLKIKDDPPLWAQVFKYGVFGVLGTVLFLCVYMLVNVFFPEYIADDLPKEILKRHLLHVLIGAFLISNLMAYITNRMFVFTPSGRSKWVELIFFLFVTALSFAAGNVAKDWFIDLGMHKHLAAVSFAFSTILVNFFTRKYLVFSKKKVVSDNGL